MTPKMEQANTNPIDKYIMQFPPPIQEILFHIKKIIQQAAPTAEETLSYQIPTFKLKKKNLVHFAAFKKHIGFYPTPEGIEQFKEELSKYKNSKGSIQFQLDEPIPYELIQKIVEFRIKTLA